MFHALSTCSARASLSQFCRPARTASVSAVLVGIASLSVLTATLPLRRVTPMPVPALDVQPAASLVLVPGGTLSRLNDAAETLRARLLSVPGVGAVSLRGLQMGGLVVQYVPSQLARLGIRDAELQAALPVQTIRPGSITVQPAAAQAGLMAVASLPVTAGPQVVRLGDVAAVNRILLPAPISTLSRDGRPMVDLVVTPARGAAGRGLDRRVAASLSAASLPSDVRMR